MKYVITGGSGYIGTRLTEFLVGRDDTELIAIADVRPPRYPRAKVQFHRTDVRERAQMHALLERIKPDALVHLAFILNPIHDEALMYEVDVNGTLHTLEAAAEAGTPQVLVTSSTTAYGAWPDNPEPIEEDWILRGQPDYAYARDKTEADRICQLWALRHPDRVMTIVRPSIVLGPNVDNYLVRTWETLPFFPRFRGVPDANLQFVHEDDLAEAIALLLVGRHAGAFNAVADGVLTWQESAELAGMKVRSVPFGLLYRVQHLMWKLKMPRTEAPAGNLNFVRYPWVCSNRKLKETAGWQPRHDTRQTFLETLRARGVIGASAGEQAAALASVGSPNGSEAGERAGVS